MRWLEYSIRLDIQAYGEYTSPILAKLGSPEAPENPYVITRTWIHMQEGIKEYTSPKLVV